MRSASGRSTNLNQFDAHERHHISDKRQNYKGALHLIVICTTCNLQTPTIGRSPTFLYYSATAFQGMNSRYN